MSLSQQASPQTLFLQSTISLMFNHFFPNPSCLAGYVLERNFVDESVREVINCFINIHVCICFINIHVCIYHIFSCHFLKLTCLTSSVSHVPLLTSVPFNLTSDELAWLVVVSFVFLHMDWLLFLIKSEELQTDSVLALMVIYVDNNSMPNKTSCHSFGLPCFAQQSYITPGLCFTCIHILLLTHVFFRRRLEQV